MGTIYYQQNNNLDSLSDVSGFSAALNGKTYGLKKQGGRFVPDDVSGGGGDIGGIVPDAGLYLDGANRVGILTSSNSGLMTSSSGLSVLLDPDGGLEKDDSGIKIKDTNTIDSSGPNVIVDNSLTTGVNGVGVNIRPFSGLISDSTGIGVKLGQTLQVASANDNLNVKAGNNITSTSSGVNVNKGAGFTSSNTTLDIGAGDGIVVNANNIAVRYDNATITAPGGILQANFGTIPSFSNYLSYSLSPDQSFNTSTFLKDSSGNPISIPIPNNFGAIVYFRFSVDMNSGSTGLTSPSFINIDYSGSGLTIDYTPQRVSCSNGIFDFNASSVPFHVYFVNNLTSMLRNSSGSSANLAISISNSVSLNGTCVVKEGNIFVYLFPTSPTFQTQYYGNYYPKVCR